MPSLSPARSIFVDRIMSIAACGSGQSAGVHTTEEQGAQCVEDFKGILYKMQDARKTLVADLLNEKRVDESLLDVLKFTLRQLTDSRTIGDLRQIQTPSATFQINISDEVRGLKKDVKFLDKLMSLMAKNGMVDDIWETMDIGSILAPYHPKGTDTFHEELQKVTSLLLQLTSHTEGPKPMFITDWDGTMKDYTSQYATNLQPVYSGVLMGRFAAQFTRLSAVLTAGPLRGPGILDLTSLPKNGHVKFSGSWGREWWLGGKRVVHDFGVTEEAFDAIGRLSDEMAELLSNGDFSQFSLVGSGVQKKVDRLTLGVQTVFNTVPPELTARYIDAVKERIHRVDPNGLLLQLEDHNTLEIEVCATSAGTENGEAKVWDKGDGVAALVEQLHDDLSVGKVLVAGDTTSDLPMLKNIQSKNPDGVMALFIGVNPSLQEAVLSIVGDPLRCSFPSSPDVVHAAFSQLLFVNKCLD